MYVLGKSTMIKLLVQEVEPDPDCGGTVWKHMNLRVAYVVRTYIHTYMHTYIHVIHTYLHTYIVQKYSFIHHYVTALYLLNTNALIYANKTLVDVHLCMYVCMYVCRPSTLFTTSSSTWTPPPWITSSGDSPPDTTKR